MFHIVTEAFQKMFAQIGFVQALASRVVASSAQGGGASCSNDDDDKNDVGCPKIMLSWGVKSKGCNDSVRT